MGERLQRTQVLLEPEQHEALTRLAAEEGRSLSSLVREAVEEYLTDKGRNEEYELQAAALQRIREHLAQMLVRRGGRPIEEDLTDIINEQREERVRELAQHLLDRD